MGWFLFLTFETLNSPYKWMQHNSSISFIGFRLMVYEKGTHHIAVKDGVFFWNLRKKNNVKKKRCYMAWLFTKTKSQSVTLILPSFSFTTVTIVSMVSSSKLEQNYCYLVILSMVTAFLESCAHRLDVAGSLLLRVTA